MECNSGVARCQMLDIPRLEREIIRLLSVKKNAHNTYSDPIGHQIALVNYKHDLFMGFLLFDRLEDGFAHSA
jgi:hypothetical protein